MLPLALERYPPPYGARLAPRRLQIGSDSVSPNPYHFNRIARVTLEVVA